MAAPSPSSNAPSLADPNHPARIIHENHQTETWVDQLDVEQRVLLIRQSPSLITVLQRDLHIAWLHRCLRVLPRGYDAFDSLHGWAAFWIVHSLNLLHSPVPPDTAAALVAHLRSFVDPRRGAYGGGPRQAAHLAATFATVMALVELGTDDALASIDVPAITAFLKAMKRPDGSFLVSEGGERDVRSAYCALAVGSLLNVDPQNEWLCRGVPEYIASMQAFDGGLGGTPGAEAHGGNTYCGFAALTIARATDAIDRPAMMHWAVMRQMPFEGGFSGRVNKLVDSCYSFWVGALFPLLSMSFHGECSPVAKSLFDPNRLSQYIIECCQVHNGGLRDKPGAPRDLMHTCYALSGLSIAQNWAGADDADGQNAVAEIDVVYNLRKDRLEKAVEFFSKQERSKC